MFFAKPGLSFFIYCTTFPAGIEQFYYYNILSSVALELNLRLPAIPNPIISIPLIRRAIDMITAKIGTPIPIGCASTMREIMMLSIPTKKIAALDQPALFLSTNPCINLAIPLNNKAIAPKIIKNPADSKGYAIATEDSIITSTPNPIFTMVDDLVVDAPDIPLAILSIPTIKRTIESNTITVAIADSGDANTAIERPIEISPKTTCRILSQLGDLSCNSDTN